MSRNKRKTSALQAVAVTTISALFILTALFGLYKCFSQEPTLRPSGPAAPDPDPSAAQEPENPEDADQGTGNTEIPDNEVPQNQGPENVRDLDESETPLGNFQPGDEGTIAAANRVKTRNAILAGGIGLLALIVLAAALYTYRKMRKAKHGKSGK